MARTISITKEMLLNTAFEIIKTEGLEEVTARKLAFKTGCSTQPIFRIYSGMDELYNDVYTMVVDHFAEFYNSYEETSQTPFVNLGMAYIDYAADYPYFFKLLFLDDKRNNESMVSILNGKANHLHAEVSKAKAQGIKNPGGLFTKMWIFIHGAATMMLTGDYDLGTAETKDLLEETFKSFM